MKLAERLARLGTETAFAVSAEANAWAAQGNRVFPFHLGDLNLKTPANVVEAAFRAIERGKTGYCPNGGIPELREALAADVNAARGTAYTADSVSIQPGGKPTIGKLILALVDPGDEVLYPNPGFPIYESQIEFHDGRALPYGFQEGDTNFQLDLDAIRESLTPRTKLLIYNDLQNPTAAESSDEEREEIAELARRHDLVVLSDEAYFDIRFGGRSRSIASLPGMQERTVILYTFSKKYAMTGWRLGGAVGPRQIIDMITRMNVNDESCTTHFVQWAGVEALTGDQSGAKEILQTLGQRRDLAVDLLNSIPGVRCFKPNASFYLYPNVTDVLQRKGMDYETFRRAVLHRTGVSFCTRAHFGRPLPGETQKYLRLAYSGIGKADIEEALKRLERFVQE